MKTQPTRRIALATFLALVLMLSAAIPSLAETTPVTPLLSADFGSSQWQLLGVEVPADSSQAVLSILWKNTGANPTSFGWIYDLFLTQWGRRCQPIPLPPGDAAGDPTALVQPGEEQTIRLAFSLPNDEDEVEIRVDESFGQGYGPLSLAYSPASGQVLNYTLPQPPDGAQPKATPMPESDSNFVHIVTPVPEVTDVPPGEATAIPLPIPEGESPDIPMLSADFTSSALKLVYVNVNQDSSTAVLYLEWQNTGDSPSSFGWTYNLFVSQQGARCRPVPLPEGEPSEDPEALVQPGGSQFISQAFALNDPQADFQARIDESFGGEYGPLLFTYSPGTRELKEYTLPLQPDATPLPTEEPVPEPLPTEEPAPEPLPTEEPAPEPLPTEEPAPEPLPTEEPAPEPLPTEEPAPEPPALTGESFLLDGRISFGLSSRRAMGLMGRMPDYDGGDTLTYMNEPYASMPADWTFFFDGEGKLNEMIVMFQLPTYEDPEGYVAEFDQADAYLVGLAGIPEYNRQLNWTEGTTPDDSLSPGQAIVLGKQELTSWWNLEGLSITHSIGCDEDGMFHYVYFSR